MKIAAALAALLSLSSLALAQPPSGATPPARTQSIFNNSNDAAVGTRPTRPTVFTVTKMMRLTTITTYHWNNGRGAPAGTIALRSNHGEMLGPWQAVGRPGQGGAPNVYWVADPDVTLTPGTYTVIDSDPETWAQNATSRGAGFAWGEGFLE